MKKIRICSLGLAFMMVLTCLLTSCGILDWFKPEVQLTDAPLKTEKLIDFANGSDASKVFESDGWSNGDVFNVVWKKHNVKYEDGLLKLGITEEKANAWLDDKDVEFNYTAGEARTQDYYGYGDYEVSMKPSANPGTASTFFICTGPYDLKYELDADGNVKYDEKGGIISKPNPHDEIDIEFLGSDTTHVQFNFFVNGVGGNEYMYDLGFDASKEFHTYGFRWEKDSITWFVDGEPVYKVTTNPEVETGKNLKTVDVLPSTPGRMLANYWCGNKKAEGWMGKYNGNVNDDGCQYQWIATSAEGTPLNPEIQIPPVGGGDDTGTIDWSEIAPTAPTFETAEKYTVAIDGNKTNVTYTDVGGSDYKPIEMEITELASAKNYVYLKVTNNGTEQVSVRVNVVDMALVSAGAQNMATNISATQDGITVNTDLVWGGSFFDIPAGETAELVVHYAAVANKLQLMIDSSRNDSVLRSGNITIEEIKFGAHGEIEVPHSCKDENGDSICDECGEGMIVPPSPPEHPVSGNLELTLGDFTTTIGGNVEDGYGVNVEDGKIHVEYTNIAGNSYKNIWANVSAIAGTKTTFTMKVTNNGTEAVKVRIDIESQTQVNANTTCCNVSATQDGAGVFTDAEWGGSMFVIEAGATSTLEVVYDPSKLPTNVKIMIDSHQWDDPSSHAGKIIISDLGFGGEYVPDQGGDNPVDPPVEPPVDAGLQLPFWTSDGSLYTISGNNIKYNGAGNTYACAGAPIADLAKGNNTFTVTAANNGTSDARVRFDVQGTNQVGNHKVTNTGATGGDVWTDAEWGGSTVTVPAGQSVTLVITYDENTDRGAVADLVIFVDAARGDANTYSADITLSDMAFSKVGGEDPVDPPVEPSVEGEYLSFTGNDCYTLSATPADYVNSLQVTYSSVSDATYQNVNTWIKDKAAGKGTLGVTIKNNGGETVNITVKLEGGGATPVETKVTIAPGETSTASLAYTGDVEMLYFFIDSGWVPDGTAVSHAGDITISGINFK